MGGEAKDNSIDKELVKEFYGARDGLKEDFNQTTLARWQTVYDKVGCTPNYKVIFTKRKNIGTALLVFRNQIVNKAGATVTDVESTRLTVDPDSLRLRSEQSVVGDGQQPAEVVPPTVDDPDTITDEMFGDDHDEAPPADGDGPKKKKKKVDL